MNPETPKIRAALALPIALIAALIVALIALPAAVALGQSPMPKWLTTPCAQEDSSNCFWDAGTSGNTVGHSFYSVRANRNGHKVDCILYWQDHYARRHNHCVRAVR